MPSFLAGRMSSDVVSVACRKKGHEYGKLSPWARSAAVAGTDGESEVCGQGKRHPMDFALWKGKKPGEPSWPSPWGPGRPGKAWDEGSSKMSDQQLDGTVNTMQLQLEMYVLQCWQSITVALQPISRQSSSSWRMLRLDCLMRSLQKAQHPLRS